MKLLSAVLCVFLLAGVHAQINVSRDAGEEYTFTVLAFPSTITSCHLKTNAGTTLDFIPGETVSHGDRFALQPISASMPSCMVSVVNLQASDSGEWEVSFVSPTGTGNAQAFQLTVEGTTEKEEESPEEDKSIKWLDVIEYPTKTGRFIDISLPKISQEEKCTIRSPKSDILSASEVSIEGVTVRASSNFVSCRITIGPMIEDLIGDWSLCGEYTENDEEHKRCQPVKIFWNNANRPDSVWGKITHPLFEHPVHVGKTLTPTVIGSGDVVTCHIVTPGGEDLVVTQDTIYPHVKATISHSICNVAIGPIEKDLMGEWAIYGIFRNSVTGLNEVRFPFNMFLYDEENPNEHAYNVTNLGTVQRVVNLGNTLYTEVTANAGQVDNCLFETPSGETFAMDTPYNYEGALLTTKETGIICQLAIGPITTEMLGNWKLIGKFSNNGVYSEMQQTFHIIQEDPENPIEHDREVHYFDPQTIETAIGATHRVVIHSDTFIHGESCHIRTPDGLQYKIMEGFSLNGVEVIEEGGIECGVVINVVSEDMVGDWTLIARSTRFSEAYERRLPFTIYVEVNPEGIDNGGTDNGGTDNGGNGVGGGDFMTTLDLVRDRSVEKVIGPENAVYCRLVDPQGLAVFDGFGRCTISLDKVGTEHNGVWRMFVGTAGKVLTDDYQIYITVKESEGKAVVTTHVEKQQPIVIVSCSVETAAVVQACKFRDPQGRILLATSGVSEDRYEYHGSQVSYESEVKTHECGLRITNPLVSDLGLWRCAIETTENTYFGHMAVLCPWALSDPAVAATVQQVPILKTDRSLVNVVEGNPSTMSCSVEAPIRYCYFRASNGTTFTVSPGLSTSAMEYVGAGFDAGECGVRFTSARASDSGRWSCHVGLVGEHEEQRDQFQTTVHARMRVDHYYTHGNTMTVEGIVYENRALEYCRFVRIDGFGFTSDNVPSEYTMTGLLANGECQFTSRNPTILDLHPWTVVAKIRGQDEEIARDTMEAILIGTPAPTPSPTNPEEEHEHGPGMFNNNRGLQIFFYTFMSVLLLAIVMGIWLGPKKHREWTYRRAESIRSSFSSRFRKEQHQNMPPRV